MEAWNDADMQDLVGVADRWDSGYVSKVTALMHEGNSEVIQGVSILCWLHFG
jgi:hypothetical protein